MEIKRITYKTEDEDERMGYFIKTRRGYLKVLISEFEFFELKPIKEEEIYVDVNGEIRTNEMPEL
jgi:hypothetical protein